MRNSRQLDACSRDHTARAWAAGMLPMGPVPAAGATAGIASFRGPRHLWPRARPTMEARPQPRRRAHWRGRPRGESGPGPRSADRRARARRSGSGSGSGSGSRLGSAAGSGLAVWSGASAATWSGGPAGARPASRPGGTASGRRPLRRPGGRRPHRPGPQARATMWPRARRDQTGDLRAQRSRPDARRTRHPAWSASLIVRSHSVTHRATDRFSAPGVVLATAVRPPSRPPAARQPARPRRASADGPAPLTPTMVAAGRMLVEDLGMRAPDRVGMGSHVDDVHPGLDRVGAARTPPARGRTGQPGRRQQPVPGHRRGGPPRPLTIAVVPAVQPVCPP